MSDIQIKKVRAELLKKHKDFMRVIKSAGLTGHLVVNSLYEGMLDNQKAQGYPIIKKIKKSMEG
jgi:CRISPR/Cas system-associated endoribonuclease Cas2